MESYRNKNNLLYFKTSPKNVPPEYAVSSFFFLPTPKSPQMEMTPSLGPRFQWLWFDQWPLCLSVASLYLEQLHSPGGQNIIFCRFPFCQTLSQNTVSVPLSLLVSLTICSWACARMSQLIRHQGSAHCQSQASLSLSPRAPQLS